MDIFNEINATQSNIKNIANIIDSSSNNNNKSTTTDDDADGLVDIHHSSSQSASLAASGLLPRTFISSEPAFTSSDYLEVDDGFNAAQTLKSDSHSAMNMTAPKQHMTSICSIAPVQINSITEDDLTPRNSARNDTKVAKIETIHSLELAAAPISSQNSSELLQAAKNGDLAAIVSILDTGTTDLNTSLNGLNALHFATKEGHADVVVELLNRGIRVDSVTKKRNTALHIASLAGQLKVARILLNHGAYVNSQSINGFTPLYMAAQENHADIVSLLLCFGADQNLATDDGFTPIVVALQQGHKNIVEMLFENDSKSRVRLPALHIAAKKNDVQSACLLLDAALSKSSAVTRTSSPSEEVPSNETDLQNGLTPLHIAAHYGHVEIAELLISRNADVNFVAQQNITPLHVAAKWGRDNMVRLLLHYNAHIDARTQDGLTPLHCAAKAGHENVVDTLLEHGAPITAKTKNGLTALHMAAQGDHDLAAKVLLSYKSSIIEHVTSDYLTAIHVAAHCGSANVARLLIERGSNVDASALNGFTPLHIACKKGRFALVLLLLNAGADVHARTESGLSALHVSSFVGAVQISQLLIEHGADCEARTIRGETPLHLACRADQVESIRCLVQYANADVNAGAVSEATETTPRVGDHQTPLHVATSLGFIKCMQFLLTNGAQVNVMTKSGLTPLHLAAKQGNVEAAGVLLDKGALSSINSCVKGQTGLSALHFASKYGHVKFVSLLLHKGAQPDIRGRNGLCPLHIAAHYDHANVALVLLRSGASPHNQALNGYTALHIAARRSHLEITSILLEYNVHVNACSLAGFTALHLACQFGHQDMISLLLDQQAKVNCRSLNGLTPLHLCAQENHAKCGELLVKRNADIDSQTKQGYTPLHVAAHFGHLQIVKFFVHLEANVDCRTHYGYTALHCAAQQNHLAIVRFLMEHGANANIKSTFNQTALDIARKLGHVEIVEELKTAESYIDSGMEEKSAKLTVNNYIFSSRRRQSIDMHKQSMLSVIETEMSEVDNDHLNNNNNNNSHLRRTESESALIRQVDFSEEDVRGESEYATVNVSELKSGMTLRSKYMFKPQQPENIHEEQPLMVSSDDESGYVMGRARIQKHSEKINKHSRHAYKKDSNWYDQSILLAGTVEPQPQPHSTTTLSQYFGTVMDRVGGGGGGGGGGGSINTGFIQPYSSSVLDGFDGISFDIKQSNSMLLDDRLLLHRKGNHGDSGTDSETAEDDAVTYNDADDMTTEILPKQRRQQQPQKKKHNSSNIKHHHQQQQQQQPHSLQDIDNTLTNMKNTGNENLLMRLNARQANMRNSAYKYRKCKQQNHNFLVSFIANAQGGEMIGKRHPNFRFIIPPKSASCPTRITCRFLKVQTFNNAIENEDINSPNTRLLSFDRSICPPLNDGEGLACGVIELNPVGYRFLSPVCLEVPHSAALHSGQREVVIFRSDNGEKWEEHICNHKRFMGPDERDCHSRLARIVTDDLPKYFALVTRLAFDSYNVDETGRSISSTFVPKAMAVIPEKALIKSVKVSLQAIAVEPPAPAMSAKQASALINTITPVVPGKRLIDHFLATFTSTVSARFWLVDAPDLIPRRSSSHDLQKKKENHGDNDQDESKKASSALTLVKQVQTLYRELMVVPYMATIVVFVKTLTNASNAKECSSVANRRVLNIRLMCLTETWDMDNILETKENYIEISRSKEVELVNEKPIIVEYCTEVDHKGERIFTQYRMPFIVFTQNRFEFQVAEPKNKHGSGGDAVISFYQPRFDADEKCSAFCHLTVKTPSRQLQTAKKRQNHFSLSDKQIENIAQIIGDDYMLLARELCISTSIIESLKKSKQYLPKAVLEHYCFSGDDKTINSSKLEGLNRALCALGYESLMIKFGDSDKVTMFNAKQNHQRRISDAGRRVCSSEDADDDDDGDDELVEGEDDEGECKRLWNRSSLLTSSTHECAIDERHLENPVGGLLSATGQIGSLHSACHPQYYPDSRESFHKDSS